MIHTITDDSPRGNLQVEFFSKGAMLIYQDDGETRDIVALTIDELAKILALAQEERAHATDRAAL